MVDAMAGGKEKLGYAPRRRGSFPDARDGAICGPKEGHRMAIVWMIIVGLVIGLVARAIMPGTQSLGLVMTALLGIAGSLVFGFLGQALGLYAPGQGAGFIGSVVGALILLFVVGKLRGPQAV
jgi:uncharacterized membrane protein YeaQ/YmgE (transglycosylase-associated protein family)